MTNENDDKKLDVSHIAHSFARSETRKNVHRYLCGIFPEDKSAKEISEATGHDEDVVLGALIGDKGRYKPDDSLVTLGLETTSEEDYRGQNVMTFRAISDGKDVDTLLKEYARKNNRLEQIKDYFKKMKIIK